MEEGGYICIYTYIYILEMYFLRCKLRLGGLIKCHYICSSTFHKLLRLVFLFMGLSDAFYTKEKNLLLLWL